MQKKSYKKYFILSPSDIGFHNVIKNNNKIFFYDFEYFGLDDPIKITCDFILHPANKLNQSQISLWLHGMKKNFKNIKHFEKRLNVLFPYFIFRWILIILKKLVLTNEKMFKNLNDDKEDKNSIISNRISLIKNYMAIIDNIYKNNYIDYTAFSYDS